MDNSRPKYKKKLIVFFLGGEYKIFFEGGIFPLWMPRINTGRDRVIPRNTGYDLRGVHFVVGLTLAAKVCDLLSGILVCYYISLFTTKVVST